jgi:gas vesicle protein
MMGTRSFSGTQLLVAFIAGSATGAVVALMTAPRSGKETREALQVWAQDVREKAARIPHSVGQAVQRGTQAGKEAFSESYRGGNSGSDA